MNNNNKRTAQCSQRADIYTQVYNDVHNDILDKLVDQRYREYSDYTSFCSGDKNVR